MMAITVFTKDNCPQCTVAKSRLTAAGIDFAEVNVSKSPLDRGWLIEQGHRTVPVIYLDDDAVSVESLVGAQQ